MNYKSKAGPIWCLVVSIIFTVISFCFLLIGMIAEEDEVSLFSLIFVIGNVAGIVLSSVWLGHVKRYNANVKRETIQRKINSVYSSVCWKCEIQFNYNGNEIRIHRNYPSGYIRCPRCSTVLKHDAANRITWENGTN